MSDTTDKTQELARLDALTGGAFHAPTSGERAARLREWLLTQPGEAELRTVANEMSLRDKGAARVVREKLEELRRLREQDSLVQTWAAKAEALLATQRLVLGDALAWQRDAAKAGAPLSREPLAGLKTALAERVKAIEDLQHRTQVQREAAVLLAQRIEILSTKPWPDAQAQREAIQSDVLAWHAQADGLTADPQWASVDPKFPPLVATSAQQLDAVWQAFDAALTSATRAAEDASLPLPGVPAWAEDIRARREGRAAPKAPEAKPAAVTPTVTGGLDATRVRKYTADPAVINAEREALVREAEALFKPAPSGQAADAAVVAAPSEGSPERVQEVAPEGSEEGAEPNPPQRVQESQSESPIASAHDPAPTAPATSAEALSESESSPAPATTHEAEPAPASPAAAAASTNKAETPPAEGEPAMPPRKMQEALRDLRERWRKVDRQAAPNPALWKRFDAACNRAHHWVDAWLKQLRAQSMANKSQRLALIEEVRAFAQGPGQGPDWRAVTRQLHAFSQRWRESGHLSEKLYAELQPLWKEVIHAAHEPLEAAQKASIERRRALIAEAQALAEAPQLRIPEVKALQQRWQEEAHTIALDRRFEQKLWESFRQPIDQAFAQKPIQRGEGADKRPPRGAAARAGRPLSPYEQRVFDAIKALESANAGGDASAIKKAQSHLEWVLQGGEPTEAAPNPAAGTAPAAAAQASAPEAQEGALPPGEPPANAGADTPSEPPSDTPPVHADATANEAAAVNDSDTSPTDSSPAPDAAPTEPVAPAPAAAKAAPRPVVAVRGDDRPGAKRPVETRPNARPGKGGKDSRDNRPVPRGRDAHRPPREGAEPPRPRLSDEVFRALRQVQDQAQDSLRRLAAQAHGEVLTHLMQAWQTRDSAELPSAQALGKRLTPAQRAQWVDSLSASPSNAEAAAEALLRLEVAADLPTPAAHLSARRALQLQLLTRRGQPGPEESWASDTAKVLASAFTPAEAKRLQACLKVLLRA